jgi:hypothetical protein
VERFHTTVNLGFLGPEPLLFLPGGSAIIHAILSGPISGPHYSEEAVAPEIEPGASGSVARNCDHKTTEAVSEVLLCDRSRRDDTDALPSPVPHAMVQSRHVKFDYVR